MDSIEQEWLHDRIHDLLRRVTTARLNATVTADLDERMSIAAEILDAVERELASLEENCSA